MIACVWPNRGADRGLNGRRALLHCMLFALSFLIIIAHLVPLFLCVFKLQVDEEPISSWRLAVYGPRTYVLFVLFSQKVQHACCCMRALSLTVAETYAYVGQISCGPFALSI
jgi:hypothetical protein